MQRYACTNQECSRFEGPPTSVEAGGYFTAGGPCCRPVAACGFCGCTEPMVDDDGAPWPYCSGCGGV